MGLADKLAERDTEALQKAVLYNELTPEGAQIASQILRSRGAQVPDPIPDELIERAFSIKRAQSDKTAWLLVSVVLALVLAVSNLLQDWPPEARALSVWGCMIAGWIGARPDVSKTNSPGVVERLKNRAANLSQVTRASVVAFAGWTVFALLRSVDSYVVLGRHYRQWNSDDVFASWAIPPVVVFAAYWAYRWVMQPPKRNPEGSKILAEFRHEIGQWPPEQGNAAMVVLAAVVDGDPKAFGAGMTRLTNSQLEYVVSAYERLEKSKASLKSA